MRPPYDPWVSVKRVRPAEGGLPGLDAAPFQGLRFARHQVGAVTSPPYDVVERRAVPALEALDPHNVIRLTRPRGGAARYAAAAHELAGWRRSGVLARDARPAYYVLTQSGPAGSLVGLLAAVAVPHHATGLEGGGYSSGVLPHEEVMPGPVRDRAALMRRARAQFEPILLQLEPASDGAVAAVLRDPGGDPVVEAWAPDGSRQSIHRVEDPDSLAAIGRDLAGRRALLADGHHRWAAYQRVARSLRQAEGPGPWDRGLALLVEPAVQPLALGPIHRAVSGLGFDDAVERLRGCARVVEAPWTAVADDAAWAAMVATARWPEPLSVLAVADARSRRAVLVDGWDAAVRSAPPADRPPPWRALAVSLLHHGVLGACWPVGVRAVGYHHTVADTHAAARSGHGVAVLLPAAPADLVVRLAHEGVRMPRKSTSFGPKPRSGLVMRAFDAEALPPRP